VRFKGPHAVAIDRAEGWLYVADTGNGLVQVFDLDGRYAGSLGKGFLRYPVSVAVAPEGVVYVVDRWLGKLLAFSSDGEYLHDLNPAVAEGNIDPLAVACDARGNVYISDAAGQAVYVFDRLGGLRLRLGRPGVGRGEFQFPTGIAVAQRGDIIIADSNNRRVQVFDASGEYIRAITGFLLPRGVAVDRRGNIYVADAMLNAVLVYDRQGELLYRLWKSSSSRFDTPTSIAVDESGRIYIADRGHNRIQVWGY